MPNEKCKRCNSKGYLQADGAYCPDCSCTQSVGDSPGHVVGTNKMVPPPEGYETYIEWCLEVLLRFDYSGAWTDAVERAKAELEELEGLQDET